jgi:hypothetical protein
VLLVEDRVIHGHLDGPNSHTADVDPDSIESLKSAGHPLYKEGVGHGDGASCCSGELIPDKMVKAKSQAEVVREQDQNLCMMLSGSPKSQVKQSSSI